MKSFSSIIALLMMLVGLTACSPEEVGTIFVLELNGAIKDDFGNPKVLTASKKVNICSKITMETFDSRGYSSGVTDRNVCKSLATNGEGLYAITTFENAPTVEYEIKNVSFYLKQYDANSGTYYIVGNGELDKMSLRIEKDENGEYQISAKVDFDYNDIF